MALEQTIFGRLRIFFAQYHVWVMDPKQTLGDALGFDTIAIQGDIRDRLEGNSSGFSDLLNDNIPRTTFDTDSTVADIRDFILQHCVVHDIDQYRAKLGERVRLELRDQVARLAVPPVDPASVIPADPLSKYVGSGTVPQLQDRLNKALFKYLFRPIPNSDLTDTLAVIQGRIVVRAII
jgi:hypothetical protein